MSVRRACASCALAWLLALGVGACQNESPTSVDLSILPPEPITLQIELPWTQFGANLAVYGGYSGASRLDHGILAHTYAADSLEARVLMRFAAYPINASVRDAAGTLRQDPEISFHGGYVVAFFDTLASTNSVPVTVSVGATQQPWQPGSATWAAALDTVGDVQPWAEVGGGPVTDLGTGIWDPTTGDSVRIFLDSAQVATWSNASDPVNGARLELLTDGQRLRLVGAALRLNTRSTINPDTALVLTAGAQSFTTIYNLVPAPPVDGMRVGGAPAWRTVMDVIVPAALSGPPELCAAVGCPFALAPRHVSYAALDLRSRSPAAAFQPTDSTSLDVRPVLSRAALPKSPLGNSLLAGPKRVAADQFGALEGSLVEIPITNYVRSYLAGPDPAGRPPPSTIAILAGPEPGAFTFAEFFGAGGANEPVLRLVVTVSRPMELQ